MADWRQYRKIEPGEFLVVGADTGAGGLDYSAAQFISKTKLDVPLVYHSKSMATEMTNQLYPTLNSVADVTGRKPLVAYERNNGGSFEMERLAGLNREGKYDVFRMPAVGRIDPPEAVKLGWDTNTATRPAMLAQLKEAIDNRLFALYDEPTINELFAFVVVQTSAAWRAQAEKNAHDDLVMALAIAWQLAQAAEMGSPLKPEHALRLYKTNTIQ